MKPFSNFILSDSPQTPPEISGLVNYRPQNYPDRYKRGTLMSPWVMAILSRCRRRGVYSQRKYDIRSASLKDFFVSFPKIHKKN